MLQIDTSKYDKKRYHDVEIGGEHLLFKELGAGEMLAFTQQAERIQKLSAKEKPTEKESKELMTLAQSMIKRAIDMFEDPKGGNKVEEKIAKYQPLDLFQIVNDIRTQIKNAQSSETSNS